MTKLCAIAAGCGHVEIVKLCREYGATDFDEAMVSAATEGDIEIVKLCREYGAADFDESYGLSSWSRGDIEIVKLCKEWGATNFGEAAWSAAEEITWFTVERSRIEIVKLCRSWLGCDSIHRELFQYHHKREFFGGIRDELLPVDVASRSIFRLVR